MPACTFLRNSSKKDISVTEDHDYERKMYLGNLPAFFKASGVYVVHSIAPNMLEPEHLNHCLHLAHAEHKKHKADTNHKKPDPLAESPWYRRQATLHEMSLIDFADAVSIIVMVREVSDGNAKVPLFPLDPESTAKQCWDLFVMLLLMYTTFSVPYMLAFVPAQEIQPGQALQSDFEPFDVFEICLDCFFCTDVILNFCTAFTEKGVYHTSMRIIAMHYLKTWFILDFFGSVPFDKIVQAAVVSTGKPIDVGTQSMLSGLRMVRVLKMVRAVRFLQKLGQLEQKDTTGTLKYFVSIFRAIFGMMFVAHFLACFFFMLIVEDGDNWMAAFDPLLMDKVPLLPPGHVDQIHSPPLYRHYYIHYQRSHPRIPYPSHG